MIPSVPQALKMPALKVRVLEEDQVLKTTSRLTAATSRVQLIGRCPFWTAALVEHQATLRLLSC